MDPAEIEGGGWQGPAADAKTAQFQQQNATFESIVKNFDEARAKAEGHVIAHNDALRTIPHPVQENLWWKYGTMALATGVGAFTMVGGFAVQGLVSLIPSDQQEKEERERKYQEERPKHGARIDETIQRALTPVEPDDKAEQTSNKGPGGPTVPGGPTPPGMEMPPGLGSSGLPPGMSVGPNGELLNPDGTPKLGPNGELLGPDGNPLRNEKGELLGPDGRPLPNQKLPEYDPSKSNIPGLDRPGGTESAFSPSNGIGSSIPGSNVSSPYGGQQLPGNSQMPGTGGGGAAAGTGAAAARMGGMPGMGNGMYPPMMPPMMPPGMGANQNQQGKEKKYVQKGDNIMAKGKNPSVAAKHANNKKKEKESDPEKVAPAVFGWDPEQDSAPEKGQGQNARRGGMTGAGMGGMGSGGMPPGMPSRNWSI